MGLIGAGALLQTALLVDPSLADPGSLLRLIVIIPTLSIIGLLFLADYGRAARDQRSVGLLMTTIGFGAYASWASWRNLFLQLAGRGDPTPWATGNEIVGEGLRWFATFTLLGLTAWLAYQARRSGDAREGRRMRWFVPAMLLPILLAAISLIPSTFWGDDADVLARRIFDNTMILLVPAFLSYAMVRYRLLGLDVKLRWTIRSGTLAGAFLAVFFVVAATAQSFLQDQLSWILGGLATGLLVFALTPLQRFAERVAARAMPDAVPIARLAEPDRIALYRDLLESAWMDGSLSIPERRVLHTAQKRLGISAEQAIALEAAATRRGEEPPTARLRTRSRPARPS